MGKILKFITIVIAGLVLFSIALVFVLFTVIDPNRYRGTLETLVARQTGLQLSIGGDMSWTFRPVFGISIGDVRLRNPGSPQELASFSTIALRISPTGLLRGQLNMEELLAENLHVNWIVDSQGNSNWPARGSTTSAPVAETASSSENDIQIALNIQQITVRNARFALQDQQRGINTLLQNINISSRDTNLDNRPFPLTASMNFLDYTGGRDLEVELDTTAAIDMDAGNLQLSNMQLNLSPLRLSGNVTANNFMDDLSWQAQLSSNTFPLPHLIANFVPTDENLLPPPNQQQLTIHQLRANGDMSNIRVETLDLGLGASDRASLTANVTLAEGNRPLRVSYELNSNNLDIDTWMPPAETASAPAGGDTGEAADIELPLEALNSMNLRGNHNIGTLRVAGLQFSPLQFGLVLENGELALDTQSAGFYGGNLDVMARMNSRRSPAQLALTTELNNINSATLTADIPALDFFNGRFDLNTTHIMTGNTVNALLDSISGSSQLQMSDSTVNITMIKQVFSAISVLSPRGDMASSWPDILPINTAQAVLNFSNGLASNQELSLRLDNFDIAGTGGIDLRNGRFDYQMAFAVLGEPAPQTLVINEDFQNIEWPIRCNAAFSDSPARYCAPDLQRVREVFTQAARDEIQRRATDAIGGEVERVRDRLRNLFQQQ